MKSGSGSYIAPRMALVAVLVCAFIVILFWPKSNANLSQDGVKIEANGVTVVDDDNGITLTRNCGCEGKQNATLINLTGDPTVRSVQKLGPDGTVLAEWNIPLLPSEVRTLRLQKQDEGSLRIKKKVNDIKPAL